MYLMANGGMKKMKIGLLRTSDGSEINLTEDMFEDLHVLSNVYNVSIKDLIENIFDTKLQCSGNKVKNLSCVK